MTAVDVALVVLAAAFLAGVVRVAIGPTLPDRAVAADVSLFAVVAAVALLALEFGTFAFVDVVLVATLLGFVATAALAWLLSERRR